MLLCGSSRFILRGFFFSFSSFFSFPLSPSIVLSSDLGMGDKLIISSPVATANVQYGADYFPPVIET